MTSTQTVSIVGLAPRRRQRSERSEVLGIRLGFWAVALPSILALMPADVVANTYQMVIDHAATWAQANAASQSAGGYLATITSASEQAAVEAAIAAANPVGQGGVWINLRETTECCYVWDNGEAPSYGHFLPPGEPNNLNGQETRGHILWSNDPGRRGYWNDIHENGVSFPTNDIGRMGYVIEFGAPGSGGSGCVPVPPTACTPSPPVPGVSPLALTLLALLTCGTGGFFLRRRLKAR